MPLPTLMLMRLWWPSRVARDPLLATRRCPWIPSRSGLRDLRLNGSGPRRRMSPAMRARIVAAALRRMLPHGMTRNNGTRRLPRIDALQRHRSHHPQLTSMERPYPSDTGAIPRCRMSQIATPLSVLLIHAIGSVHVSTNIVALESSSRQSTPSRLGPEAAG